VGETDNENLERCFLGTILLFPANMDEARGIVTSEMFTSQINRQIFAAMCSLGDRQHDPDMVSLKFMLGSSPALKAAGGVVYFSELMNAVPHSGQWEFWARQIADEYRKRMVRAALSEAQESAGQRDAGEVAAEAVQKLERIMQGAVTMPKSLKQISAESAVREVVPRISTGFRQLDDYLCGGFGEGRFIIVAGDTSMGKSQFAVNLLAKMEKDSRPARSLYICQEMTPDEILGRFIALFGNLDNQAVEVMQQRRAVQSTIDNFGGSYKEGLERSQKAQILVEAEGHITASRIRALSAQKYTWPDGHRGRAEVVILDYIQQCSMEGWEKDKRDHIGNVSQTCKSIARRYNIPFIGLSQLKRHHGQDRPLLDHLKESGDLEQDADTVILLYREKKKGELEEELECELAKNRGGPLGIWKNTYSLPTGQMRCIPGT